MHNSFKFFPENTNIPGFLLSETGDKRCSASDKLLKNCGNIKGTGEGDLRGEGGGICHHSVLAINLPAHESSARFRHCGERDGIFREIAGLNPIGNGQVAGVGIHCAL